MLKSTKLEFEAPAMQGMWKLFGEIYRKKDLKKWREASQEKRLTRFVKWMSAENVIIEYERRKLVML